MPYYAQANEQVEATNKILIDIVKKNLEENPKRWHEMFKKHYGPAEILQPKQPIVPHFADLWTQCRFAFGDECAIFEGSKVEHANFG